MHEIRIIRSVPIISHIFFSDDNIKTTRVIIQEAQQISFSLQTYEHASGQKVNLDKSQIFFNWNVVLTNLNFSSAKMFLPSEKMSLRNF